MVRRQRRRPAHGSGWLLTYSDLVTLLMAFFVMLYALGQVEEEKFLQFLSGLSQFDNPMASGEMTIEPQLDPFEAPEQGPDTTGPQPADVRAAHAAIALAVERAGLQDRVEVGRDERGVTITIETDDVLFATGSSVLTDEGRRILDAISPPLTALANDVIVEGHADRRPLDRGGYTNWNLSTDRAVAVVQHLVRAQHVAPERLAAAGFGEFRPRDPGSSPEALRRNRRVEIVVVDAALTAPAATAGGIPDPIGPPVTTTILAPLDKDVA